MAKKARPKLGQHFLTSDTYRRRIMESLSIGPDDVVLEIGPGRGAMTGLLLERARSVVAVELDQRLADGLRENYASDTRVEVEQADILQTNLAEICGRHRAERLFAFGNLPYYITSPILHHLLNSAAHVSGMAFVVQREVAERIATKPSSRAYGYLSVLTQAFAAPRVAFVIPPGAFSPPPAVHSALVTFEMQGALAGSTDDLNRDFLDFVKLSFSQKRKKLVNNLAATYPAVQTREALRAGGFKENARAEELSVQELMHVFRLLQAEGLPGEL